MNQKKDNENKSSENLNANSEKSEGKLKVKKRSKKKIILIIIAIFISVLLIIVGVMGYLASQEIVRDVTVKNSDGKTGTVFVVIRPGVSSFQDDVTNALIRGLVKADWRVESTSSHKNTPVNVSAYDLFVFGSPTYGSQPHQSLLDYIDQVDLNEKPVILLVTSGGDSGGKKAAEILREAVTDANGNVTDELVLLTGNNPGGDAESLAYDLGKSYTAIPK